MATLKKIFLIIVFLLLVLLGGATYYLYTQNTKNAAELQNLRQQNAIFFQNEAVINDEADRCKELIAQEEGNFDDFTYCQSFLEFVDGLQSQVE